MSFWLLCAEMQMQRDNKMMKLLSQTMLGIQDIETSETRGLTPTQTCLWAGNGTKAKRIQKQYAQKHPLTH